MCIGIVKVFLYSYTQLQLAGYKYNIRGACELTFNSVLDGWCPGQNNLEEECISPHFELENTVLSKPVNGDQRLAT